MLERLSKHTHFCFLDGYSAFSQIHVSKEDQCHFMVNEGIVLGHKISKRGIEVDKAKVDAIEKMSCPKDIKGIRSFLGHVGFYRRFIKDLSKISSPPLISCKKMFLLFLMMIV